MTTVVPPENRECERCGREDFWDHDAQKWRIVEEEGHKLIGDPHCLHEWDITGTYNPLSSAE